MILRFILKIISSKRGFTKEVDLSGCCTEPAVNLFRLENIKYCFTIHHIIIPLYVFCTWW